MFGQAHQKEPLEIHKSDSKTSSEESNSESDSSQSNSETELDFIEPFEPQIQQILGVHGDESPEEPLIYYVKWSGKSYLHCSWMALDELLEISGGDRLFKNFSRKISDDDFVSCPVIKNLLMPSQIEFNPSWMEPERIIGHRNGMYLVKWKLLSYDQCTWEQKSAIKNKKLIKKFKTYKSHFNPTVIDPSIRGKDTSQFSPFTEPLSNRDGLLLRKYQLEGVNWLRFCWFNHRNSILADEMGLGKTVQVVCVLNDISLNHNINGPFLVLAPLSTLGHWVSELERWTDLNVVLYHDSPIARRIIEKYEFPSSKTRILNSRSRIIHDPVEFSDYGASEGHPANRYDGVKFDVLVTNYETFVTDFEILKNIQWRYLVLDEGHRLKNHTGKCYQLLSQLKFEHCTLLTGTPIQNNVEELWSLLHLLHPNTFSDLSGFLESYGNIDNMETLQNLQNLISPYLLRRKKNDVDSTIAAKEETIIEVELTRIQKAYYSALLHRNASTLLQQITGGSLPSLLNLMMQLRKVCNHPYLIKGATEKIEEEIRKKLGPDASQSDVDIRGIIESSGKMILIDKLLPKLQADGHKVLIFSQMVKVLDIIEDYLSLKNILFERIDGSISESERKAAIERFGNDDSIFVFLLCTRAGGVGINLTAADTVIIYDSDWNPQNDVQAQSRCHRIGQKAKVKVYRLVTRGTYELEMLDRASRKLGLDHAILDSDSSLGEKKGEKMDKPTQAAEVEKLLRHGAYDILHDNDNEIDNFCDADIDQILERRTKEFKMNSTYDGNSMFSKAKFSTGDKEEQAVDPVDFWKSVLPESDLNQDEALNPRRCRMNQQNFADSLSSSEEDSLMSEKIHRKVSPVSIRGTIRNLLNRGLTENKYEKAILFQAAIFSKESNSLDEEDIIIKLLGIKSLEKPSNDIKDAIDEFSSNMNDVRERKSSIIRRCLIFLRIKPILEGLQGKLKSWPISDGNDPIIDYTILLYIFQNGFSKGLQEIEKIPGFETKNATLKGIEKKISTLFEALEPMISPMPDVTIESPENWKKNHMELYNRTELTDEELQNLFYVISCFGIVYKSNQSNQVNQSNSDDNIKQNQDSESEKSTPQSSIDNTPSDNDLINNNTSAENFMDQFTIDWAKIREVARLNCISLDAITMAGEQILTFSTSYDVDPASEKDKSADNETEGSENTDQQDDPSKHNFISHLGTYGGRQWQRKLRNSIRNIEKIRQFVHNLQPSDTAFIERINPIDSISWWTSSHDIALLKAIAEFGQLFVTRWIVDPDRPFREHISENLLEDFEHCAEAEIQKGRQVKPKDPGDLSFLFKDKLRISRALTIIRYVETMKHKDLSQDKDSFIPKLPIALSKSLIVYSLGKFVRKGQTIPVDYKARCSFLSLQHPWQQAWYEESTSFGEDEKTIIFKVKTIGIDPEVEWTGNTPNEVWEEVRHSLMDSWNKIDPKTNLIPAQNGTILFGFTHQTIFSILKKQLKQSNLSFEKEEKTESEEMKSKSSSNANLIIPPQNKDLNAQHVMDPTLVTPPPFIQIPLVSNLGKWQQPFQFMPFPSIMNQYKSTIDVEKQRKNKSNASFKDPITPYNPYNCYGFPKVGFISFIPTPVSFNYPMMNNPGGIPSIPISIPTPVLQSTPVNPSESQPIQNKKLSPIPKDLEKPKEIRTNTNELPKEDDNGISMLLAQPSNKSNHNYNNKGASVKTYKNLIKEK